MYYSKIINFDSGNADGLSVVLFVSGCDHHCKGCHNPETWNSHNGSPFTNETTEDLVKKLQNPHIKNFVISGGDPLFKDNQQEIIQLINKIKPLNKQIILYTGYTIEQIKQMEIYSELLIEDLIIIDGEFELDKISPILDYRGSINQRAFKCTSGGFVDISKNYFKLEKSRV